MLRISTDMNSLITRCEQCVQSLDFLIRFHWMLFGSGTCVRAGGVCHYSIVCVHKAVQTVSVYLNKQKSCRHLSCSLFYSLTEIRYTIMSTQASSGGDPQGPGACTLCDCPRFVGNQSGCTRLGCGHGYGQRTISYISMNSKLRLT